MWREREEEEEEGGGGGGMRQEIHTANWVQLVWPPQFGYSLKKKKMCVIRANQNKGRM